MPTVTHNSDHAIIALGLSSTILAAILHNARSKSTEVSSNMMAPSVILATTLAPSKLSTLPTEIGELIYYFAMRIDSHFINGYVRPSRLPVTTAPLRSTFLRCASSTRLKGSWSKSSSSATSTSSSIATKMPGH
jgi:hypothetical protein